MQYNRSFSLRHHSTNDSSKKKKAEEGSYEKSFEDLLGKSQSTSGPTLEEQIKQRQKESAEAQERFEKDKADFEQKKQQDFEDLLSGKKIKSKDEMSLQDLFKEYYSKVKSSDPKEYVNSARSSLNSFSSLLEKKRQAAQQKKEEAAAQTPKTAGEEQKAEATQQA